MDGQTTIKRFSHFFGYELNWRKRYSSLTRWKSKLILSLRIFFIALFPPSYYTLLDSCCFHRYTVRVAPDVHSAQRHRHGGRTRMCRSGISVGWEPICAAMPMPCVRCAFVCSAGLSIQSHRLNTRQVCIFAMRSGDEGPAPTWTHSTSRLVYSSCTVQDRWIKKVVSCLLKRAANKPFNDTNCFEWRPFFYRSTSWKTDRGTEQIGIQ